MDRKFAWGSKLRFYRLKAGFKTLDDFANYLADLGYVTDVTTLSRYESNPERIPRKRDRHMFLIKSLVNSNAIEGIDDANELLDLANMG